ncbi:spermatogenesis-associated protein 1-like isoform X4 [Mercenaria mercenaria]|uniref:spermatogenesis-associated protein 1-like isoform X4 n=1 Tax=Mercenaria mercenaria TaxID=6596 RepID=UPI001E1DFC07|nr:spermatogenesis-associated protein 1-like isoform X4 [Mercenaria mercenaria]
MSARMNGYSSDRERRPASEQMSDLHVYLVPPEIWREKYHNALNQNINETVSIGFIRVHPETKVYALRDEIEQQLGTDNVPREYVFVKSVGRSLTRVKARQEATLKVKNFLPPQAYAPELYLLEATPEVRQQIAASSENSTRPETRTSYDYDFMNRQNKGRNNHYYHGSDESLQNSKRSNLSNGADLNTHYATLPQITPRNINSPEKQTRPVVYKTSATPREQSTREPTGQIVQQNKQYLSVDWDSSDKQNSYFSDNQSNNQNSEYSDNQSNTNVGQSQEHLRVSHPHSDSAPNLDPPQHHLASSPRRQQQPGPQEAYLQPLSATPPHNDSENDKNSKRHHGNHGNQHKHDEDSGIAGFTPDTYRENEPLDRRKNETDERVIVPSPEANESDRLDRSQNENDTSDWERRRKEEQDRQKREEEERRRREEEENRRDEQDREDRAEQSRLMRTNSDQLSEKGVPEPAVEMSRQNTLKESSNISKNELTRYPSPPPLRLASPDRDTASARARRKKQKEELLRELEEAREARRAAERQREELVKHAKQMQTKTQNKRNHARDLWKKRYFEEKKKTGPLEEQCNRLRHELDIIHKKLLTTLEGPKEKATKLNDIKPSNKNSFKIQATRLQHEIEDIRRRVDHAKMKLTSEMKLRNQAETELRALRAELTQKKINLTLSRNSHLTTYAPPAADVNLISARTGLTPRS